MEDILAEHEAQRGPNVQGSMRASETKRKCTTQGVAGQQETTGRARAYLLKAAQTATRSASCRDA
jgi:hypothetical protein